MKIIKIIPKNKKEYEIILEKSDSFLIFDETILKFNVMIGKILSNDDLSNIRKYNNLMKEYFACIKKIKSKLKTEKEIFNYLKEKKLSEEDILIIIEKLHKINLINDNKYIEAFINDSIYLSLNGPYKIKNELVKKGFESNKIDIFLESIDDNLWMEKINKFINKKIKENRKLSGKEFKYKIKSDLIYLGYPAELFLESLDNINISNDLQILEKEYHKLKKKYSKKINDVNKLNLKIKYDLVFKGYSEEEIENVLESQ